jgi:hypothetical protein
LDDVENTKKLSIHDLFKYSGNNSGNLFIGEAVRFHIRRFFPNAHIEHHDFNRIRTTSGKEISEKFDYIVMAASNMLSPTNAFGFVAKFVEDSGLPLIILGIGAQAENESEMYQINPGTLRLMKYAADTSRNGIGVRGAFTAELLKHHGVENVQIIGCPTFYKNSGKNFIIQKAPRADELRKVAVSFKRDRNKYESDRILARIQRDMFELAMSRGFYCIEQAHFAEAWMSHNDEIDQEKVEGIRKYFGISEDRREELVEYIKHRISIFFEYAAWKKLVEECDFAFGARFHGNMMAMTSGVPALWITHDSRTAELCDTLGLPKVTAQEIERKGFDLQDLIDRANYDQFNQNYQEKCDFFDDFFKGQFGI